MHVLFFKYVLKMFRTYIQYVKNVHSITFTSIINIFTSVKVCGRLWSRFPAPRIRRPRIITKMEALSRNRVSGHGANEFGKHTGDVFTAWLSARPTARPAFAPITFFIRPSLSFSLTASPARSLGAALSLRFCDY